MSKSTLACCLFSLLLGTMLPLRAETVPDLYAAVVPVADQSTASLNAAASEALAVVLVKVSGSAGLLRNPDIAAALRKARGQVQQYAYLKAAPGGEGLSVRIEFDGALVTQLVTDAGAPLWTANRPEVLVWMVQESPSGPRFVSTDDTPETAAALFAAFARRGVPVRFPLFDLQDSGAVSPQDVWNRNPDRILKASTRYNVENVVAGRISAQGAARSVEGDWRYLFEQEQIDRRVRDTELRSFMDRGANLVADEMVARYAVASVGAGGQGIRMAITGVSRYADYAGIVGWLESLELIDFANVERVEGDRLELRLQARADASQLPTLIELNERLRPTAIPEPGFPLSYQWRN